MPLIRIFSLNFDGGTHNFSPPSGMKLDGGGTCEKKIGLKPKLPAKCKIRPFFCYFKHEIQLFNVLLSLKVVKFDTKMYFNFSNFLGWNLGWGGNKLCSKNGDKCRWGDLLTIL